MISGYIRMGSTNSMEPMNFNTLVPELIDFEILILEFKDLGTHGRKKYGIWPINLFLEPMEWKS